MATYNFSTLYTILPLNLINENLTGLNVQTLNRQVSVYLTSSEKRTFSTSGHVRKFMTLSIIFWNMYIVFIKFSSKLYRQIVGSPVST